MKSICSNSDEVHDGRSSRPSRSSSVSSGSGAHWGSPGTVRNRKRNQHNQYHAPSWSLHSIEYIYTFSIISYRVVWSHLAALRPVSVGDADTCTSAVSITCCLDSDHTPPCCAILGFMTAWRTRLKFSGVKALCAVSLRNFL